MAQMTEPSNDMPSKLKALCLKPQYYKNKTKQILKGHQKEKIN
jgi:hypothetical protein